MLLALVLAGAAGTAHAASGCDTTTPPLEAFPASVAMAAAAQRHGLLFGSAANGFAFSTAGRYRSLLAREFSILMPENELKWALVHPERGVYRFERADCLAEFAQAHGQKIFGGPLVWNNQMPPWMTSSPPNRGTAIALLREHMTTLMTHYRQYFPGTVVAWEVVNEAIQDEGCDSHCSLSRTLWYDAIGPDYVDLAFQIAHEADPTATLYYNEIALDNATPRAKVRREYLLKLLDHWRHDGVPVDGVGLQMHVPAGGPAALMPGLGEFVKSIAARGFDVAMTEVDVAAPYAAGARETAPILGQQAAVFRAALQACLDEPRCRIFQLWGFSDAVSWLRGQRATPLDEDFQPKLAWVALLEELQQHPVVPRATAGR